MSEKPCGAYFFAFFENFFVPILTSGGYVGLSIATLLSQHHKVTAVDIIPEKVDMINNRKSPIQDDYVLEILHERERKALICFSALERQEEKLSAEKAEIVKQRVALYEQYADGNMSKEEFIRQRDAYRVQEDEKMEQIQRLRTEKNQAFQPVKRDTDHLQTVMSTVEEAGDVMYLSQNVVETFIDRIEVFNDEHVKIHFTFENVLADYAE